MVSAKNFREKELMQSYVVILSRAAGKKILRHTYSGGAGRPRRTVLLSLPGGFYRQVYGDVHSHLAGNKRENGLCEMEFQILPGKRGKLRKKHIRNGLIMIE